LIQVNVPSTHFEYPGRDSGQHKRREAGQPSVERKDTMLQDAAKADPRHYHVEFENDKIRVLRVKYPPGEKSVMHSHPDSLHVCLTDVKARITNSDGTTEDVNLKAGQIWYHNKFEHQPENIDDKPLELVHIEFKY
jgi:quercetin dioxygenase-like cupin family protein